MNERVREILGWYRSDSPGTLANLARLMNHGRLGGTGRFVILPVDQGFEHGPARSPSRPTLPVTTRATTLSSRSTRAATPTRPRSAFSRRARRSSPATMPMILKLNNSESLAEGGRGPRARRSPARVDEALRLGCAAIGFTIYPGSA